MNTQEELFEKHYSDLYTHLIEFIVCVCEDGLGSEELDWSEGEIVGQLCRIYANSLQSEFETITEQLDVESDTVLKSHVDFSANVLVYGKENKDRLKKILDTHAENIIGLMKQGLQVSDIILAVLPDMVTLAMSEVQIAIERASVYAGKVLQKATGIKIYKVWHSVNDELTCDTCKALDGTIVGVDEAFVKGDVDEDVDLSGLDYTGGDIAYAHPRCRCWVTYTTKEV